MQFGDWRDRLSMYDRSTWPRKMAAAVEAGGDPERLMHQCFGSPEAWADPLVQKFTPATARAFTAVTKLAPSKVDEELREFSGIASAPEIDRQNEVVALDGVHYKNPSVLLWQHRPDQPIGQVWFTRTADAIRFRARIPRIETPCPLRDSVESAWAAVKARIVTSVSIGFRALETERRPDGILVYTKSELYELSLVSVPALPAAQIDASTIKSVAPVIHAHELPNGLTKQQKDDLRKAEARRILGDLAPKAATNETVFLIAMELRERLSALERRA